jgi:site-specific DNA-methyltransferase (adenine-specific)
MQAIAVSKLIITPDRQRKEFDPQALGELSETIRTKGLMHALVIRETPEGSVLVAGERRLRAIQDMWMLGGALKHNGQVFEEGTVPFVTLGQLSPLEAEEAELEENLHRKDLTWQENAAAMAKLHRIRSAQAQAEGRIHTVADTAMETKGRSDGSYQDSVRKDLIVAKHLDNPEVAKAKSTEEAFKILKRQEVTAKNIELAQSIGRTFSASVHELHNMNCISYMQGCEAGTFDVILTDPPYGMGAQDFGDGGGRLANSEHHYDDSYESWVALMEQWCPLSFRVTKPQAHAYVFCDLDNFHKLKELMKAAGWYVFRTPIINFKPNSGRVPLPDEGPRRQYEIALYAIKGHKKTTAIYSDVIATVQGESFQHGAQKPVALYENLLLRSVRAGDTVLDCFAGSGTIFPAAHTHKCKAIGIEMSKEYYGMCLGRIAELDKPASLAGQSLGDELTQMMGL